jgi:hypothetical protein
MPEAGQMIIPVAALVGAVDFGVDNSRHGAMIGIWLKAMAGDPNGSPKWYCAKSRNCSCAI